jgi:hypothetical protein
MSYKALEFSHVLLPFSLLLVPTLGTFLDLFFLLATSATFSSSLLVDELPYTYHV